MIDIRSGHGEGIVEQRWLEQQGVISNRDYVISFYTNDWRNIFEFYSHVPLEIITMFALKFGNRE